MNMYLVGDGERAAVVAAHDGETALRLRPPDITPVTVFEFLGEARPWVRQGVVVSGRKE